MEQLVARLTEARAAYHLLMVGGQPVEVRDSNGESVRYSTANASRLFAYIKSLEEELAQLASGKPRSRVAMRPVWG